jgi:hypothetical protein
MSQHSKQVKKYLISGIPPSHGGVGYLMHSLVKLAPDFGFESIYPVHTNFSLKALFTRPYNVVKSLVFRRLHKNVFLDKIKGIKDSEVILIHPQTIGFYYFFELIKSNCKVKVYIMDNSFFCIKSYNTLNGSECTKCLNSLDNCDINCHPFPVSIDRRENIMYLELYKKFSKNIEFYAQSSKQKELLKLHFGDDTDIKIIGMRTDEKFIKTSFKSNKRYDIVFHGENHEAKGIEYILKLAQNLLNYNILIPCDRKEVEVKVPISKNIIFKKMDWDSGLKIEVENAGLVINPSIWSSAVEGALLKSIFYNGNVAVINTKYGFVNDIPNEILLKLTYDMKHSAKIIETFFVKKIDMSEDSKKWLKFFFDKECDTKELFN